MKTELIVYGVNCVWWDNISKADQLPSGVPCCPHCSSVLFQTEEDKWNEGVAKAEQNKPGYQALIDWMKGKCFRTMTEAVEAHERSKHAH